MSPLFFMYVFTGYSKIFTYRDKMLVIVVFMKIQTSYCNIYLVGTTIDNIVIGFNPRTLSVDSPRRLPRFYSSTCIYITYRYSRGTRVTVKLSVHSKGHNTVNLCFISTKRT